MRRVLELTVLLMMVCGIGYAQEMSFCSNSLLSGVPPTLGACSTSHSLSDTDDLLVCGKLEVNDTTYFDGITYMVAKETYWTDSAFNSYLAINAGRAQEDEAAHICPSGNNRANNTIAIVSSGNMSGDYANDTDAVNATLKIYSATAATTATNQWLSFTHDQTNGVISAGTGVIDLNAGVAVATEAVTCNDTGDTCAYSAAVVSTRLTAGADAAADTVTVTDGTDGQRRTFTVAAGTDDVVVDIMTNGSAAANVTLDAVGDSVTIEYMATGDTWWIISSYGL